MKYFYIIVLLISACSKSTESGQTPTPPVTFIVKEVTSKTGRIWLDRNLGASQVATSSTDVLSYGDLYQWGRGSDGHQKRTSLTTKVLSNTDIPGNANFILSPNSPYDWRSTKNNNLWQGLYGLNNPCPSGYRLPTSAEWNIERLSWISNNAAGAFASPLKLPLAGARDYGTGEFGAVGTSVTYWSSTVNGANSYWIIIFSTGANIQADARADGICVRCIKD